MSSYFNNLLTHTTSRYNNLRRQLLSDDADGDTEDNSHISRTLRAYYVEKGRPFPEWLPPDPKTPQPQQQQARFATSSGRQQAQVSSPGRGGGGLSDLWDTPQQSAPQQEEPLSLRRTAGSRGGPHRQPGRMGKSLTPEPQSQGRPLPSQRAGSYQGSLMSRQQEAPSPPLSAGGGTTAQDRLKARLWGGNRSGQGASSPPAQASPPPAQAPRSDQGNDHYGGRNSGGGGDGGSGGGQQLSYNMSSDSPWSGNNGPYAPQRGGYEAPQRSQRMGLPSNPRRR